MKVMIVPEDPINDAFILQPVVEHILADLKLSARVEVLRDPHLRSANQALNKDILKDIVLSNPMIDLFLLMVDRDCDRQTHSAKAEQREREFPDKLVACLAIEEVETWMLALYRGNVVPWKTIRSHCDPKEAFAEPFLKKQGWWIGVGQGRKQAMRALDGNSWKGLKSTCPEIKELQQKIKAWYKVGQA